MTRDISPDIALFVGNGHEFHGLRRDRNLRTGSRQYNHQKNNMITANFDLDTLMDLWNNGIGIQLGQQNWNISSSTDAFEYAYMNNLLILDTSYVLFRFQIDESFLNENGTLPGIWLPSRNIFFIPGTTLVIDFNTGTARDMNDIFNGDNCNTA